ARPGRRRARGSPPLHSTISRASIRHRDIHPCRGATVISLHHIRVALATVAALTALVALACATSLHRSGTGETPRLTHHTAPLATPDSSVDIQAGIDSLLLGTRYCVHVTPAPAATDGAQRWNVELVQQVPGEVMLDTWRPELGNCPLAPAFVDL